MTVIDHSITLNISNILENEKTIWTDITETVQADQEKNPIRSDITETVQVINIAIRKVVTIKDHGKKNPQELTWFTMNKSLP